jgi:hypothetical protein
VEARFLANSGGPRYELANMDRGLHDFLIRDGSLIDARFERFVSWVSPLFAAIGIRDAAVQHVVVLGGIVALLWAVARRLSRVGYRINPPVGMVVEAAAVGSVLILLAAILPAWIAFRQTSIQHAVVAFFTS